MAHTITKENLIRSYVAAIEKEEAAIFAGAGLSAGSGMVNWKNLLRDMASELELDIDKETDLVSLAQYYRNEAGNRGAINQTIIEAFTTDEDPNDNHRLLASLPIQVYWTTNYDTLIESSLKAQGKNPDVKHTQQQLAYSSSSRGAIVYKMHGDCTQPHDAVLTKDDYECYNEKRKLFTTVLQGDLVSKTFLFIGFSFDDPNLSYILSRIRALLDENHRNHYCFFREVNESDFKTTEEYAYASAHQKLKMSDLKRYGIQPVLVKEYSEITEVLKEISRRVKQKNIYISGAAANYGEWCEAETGGMIADFAEYLAEKKRKVITGFGLGIGKYVVNGVLKYVYRDYKKLLDDYLLTYPFPQIINDDPLERANKHRRHREILLENAGVAVFLFGNKNEARDGRIVESDGMMEEFEIAKQKGIRVIPVGCTPGSSQRIWHEVMANPSTFLLDDFLVDIVRQLSPDNRLTPDAVLALLKKAVDHTNT